MKNQFFNQKSKPKTMNTAVKTAPKNGQEAKPETAPKVVDIKPTPTPPSGTEGKILQIINVGQKIKRRSQVLQAKANLVNFIFDGDSETAEIEFQDQNRHTYRSTDKVLMKRIQKCILDCIDEEVAQLNAEIELFKI